MATKRAAHVSQSEHTIATLFLALANFMSVLDLTIANVSVPHIAGSTGVSLPEGTWIITSYGVAEAVGMALTGFLGDRFGHRRTFLACIIGFGASSAFCGLSNTLTQLVAFRVLQGAFGGPIVPLSQALLLDISTKEQHAKAVGTIAMTGVIAPVLGPIVGGLITDNLSWHWIFLLNVPVVAVCYIGVRRFVHVEQDPSPELRADLVGLILLIVSVACCQITLDLGRQLDWTASALIKWMIYVGLLSGSLFLAWTVNGKSPIVRLGLLRNPRFFVGVTSFSILHGTFYSSMVLVPQLLQDDLGYTATWAGIATSGTAIGGLIATPIASRARRYLHTRWLILIGALFGSLSLLLRTRWSNEIEFIDVLVPNIVLGLGIPFYVVPLMLVALGSVDERDRSSAAGLLYFSRTLTAALGTALVTTNWYDRSTVARVALVSRLQEPEAFLEGLQKGGSISVDTGTALVSRIVDVEASLLAANQLALLGAVTYIVAAAAVWIISLSDNR